MITQTKILKFGEKSWKKPIVCQLARDYDISFSILKAQVLPRREGILVLEISGEEEEFNRAIAYLKEAQVEIVPIDQEIFYDDAVCVQCGACTGFCPSGALYIKDRATMEIGFNPEACIGCELCLVACPSRALSPAEEIAI